MHLVSRPASVLLLFGTLFLSCCVGLALEPRARAASFDCGKARAPREIVICNDAHLSELDSQLGHTYEEKLRLLSHRGAELLRASQRSWLRFLSAACPTTTSGDHERFCIETQYVKRLQQLSGVGERKGPFVFNRIDLFATEHRSYDNESILAFQHVAYPQIDNIENAATNAWNKMAEKALSSWNDMSDDDLDYVISYATRNLIGTTWSHSLYDKGAPHGFYDTRTDNVIVFPSPRPLTSADLFGPGNERVSQLQDLFWEALQQQGWKPSQESDKQSILSIVVQPDRWKFTDEGLTIEFESYDGGCFACTPDTLVLSWIQLKPLLAPDSVLP